MDFVATPQFLKELYQFDIVYYPQLIDGFKVWILVNYPNEKSLPEANAMFLQKITDALQLRKQDLNIGNIASPAWKNHSETNPLPYKQVWAFGVQLPTIFPTLPALTMYEPHQVGELAYLQADTLEVLQSDVERKKQLWNALQKMR
jgi:hypothetical protein